MTNDEIRAEIVGACEEFRKRGFSLVAGDGYGNILGGGKQGCALSALFTVKAKRKPIRSLEIRDLVAQSYGWNWTDAASFMSGFDGGERKFNIELYEMGRAVHAATSPKLIGSLLDDEST